MKHLPIKEAHFLIIIAGLLVSIGIAWGINTVKLEQCGLAVVSHSKCIDKAEKKILTLENEGKSRDEMIELLSEYIKEDRKSREIERKEREKEKIENAKFMGEILQAVRQGTYWGSLEGLEKVIKNYEEHQKKRP